MFFPIFKFYQHIASFQQNHISIHKLTNILLFHHCGILNKRSTSTGRGRGKYMRKEASIILLAAFAFTAGIAFGQGEPIIYPAKGQDQKQLDKDKYECYSWAKQQTGFDPIKPQQQASQAQQGAASGGAARGAATGAAIGAIGGDAGKGAATGAVIGGIRKRMKAKHAEQAQQQQAAGYASKRKEYDRAFGACLEGRGYTVK
jgi:hypothetical protein